MSNYIYFWKISENPHGVFSQWYMSEFTHSNIKYNCTEQFMMAKKAELFFDTINYKKIMNSTDPVKMRKLGRKVKNYDNAIWEEHSYKIVLQANLCKFVQDKYLRDILLATKDKILVEASPYDKIWGVGLSAKNPKILNENTWNGKNLLGKVLMNVRTRLMNELLKDSC